MASSLARERFVEIAALPDVAIDLGEAAFLIAAEEYPSLDVAEWLSRLDDLAIPLQPRLLHCDGELERLAILVSYLQDEVGLQGNEEEYYDPRNSYLNDVLERRTGIPISLAAVYLEVGKRVGIPLRGVGFPAHFLLKHEGAAEVFVDPFHGGQFLTEKDCRALLDRLTGGQIPFDRRYLATVSNRQILVRMLNNLKGIYLRRRELAKALAAVDRILLLTPNATREYRDRGTIYLQMEAFRLALADLERYLKDGPDGDDRESMAETVRTLRQRVEMLN